jgi:hypothetical protein
MVVKLCGAILLIIGIKNDYNVKRFIVRRNKLTKLRIKKKNYRTRIILTAQLCKLKKKGKKKKKL